MFIIKVQIQSATSLLIILVILGACNYNAPQPATAASSSVAVEQVSQATPKVYFAQATPIPTQVFLGEEKVEEKPTASRAFEAGLPLAARVNNQPLFLDTYQQQVTRYKQALTAQGMDITSSEGQARLAKIQQQILEGLLDQLIIEQHASRLGIVVTADEVETKARETIQDQTQFESWLANNNLTSEAFLATLRAQLIANRVFESITRNVPSTADQIQLRYMRIADETAAQTLISALKNGESFTALAQTQVDEQKQPEVAGYLDWFPQGTGLIPTPVETIAFSLQPGEMSGPIQTLQGFYIIKLEGKATNKLLNDSLLQQLKNQMFDQWLTGQRLSTIIERYLDL